MNIRRICLLDKLLDWLWPRDCAVCGRPADRAGRHVCSECLNRLPFVPVDGCCRVCGRDVAQLDGEFLCADCREYRPAFDRAASAFRFEGLARELVNGFKFRSQLWLRDDFSDWLEATVRARFKTEAIDLVVPMPSTLGHRLNRGYNQCAYLASAVAKRLGKPCSNHVVRRVGHPRRQGGLTEDERRENVIGTFAVRRPVLVRGKTVLVVDDILTTGATLSACAQALKDAGAERVWAVTLARTVRT